MERPCGIPLDICPDITLGVEKRPLAKNEFKNPPAISFMKNEQLLIE
jgi:hypothetical protein